jgi:hypothetical protein
MAERSKRFLEAYRAAYRRYYAKRTNFKTANRAGGSRSLEDLSAKQLREVWSARQCADYLEMPYDVYCELFIGLCDEFGFDKLPSLKMMSNEKMQARTYFRWLEHRKHHLILPTTPSDDEGYYKYLLEIFNSRPNPKYFVKHLLHHSLLSRDDGVRLFGKAVMEQV